MEKDSDGIAIIGVGCRFPGADNLEEFWQVLVQGENHVKEVPAERWNLDSFYDANPDAVGKTYVRKAGFLKNYDAFDNKLFGINDLEAAQMDPQQRFALECVFMALQDAGITRKKIAGTKTGVYIGDCNMAICGGVNALLSPDVFIQLSKAKMMSATGQCQAFSASADGYARGEGCGIVLLKRLSDARKNGDKIWATITTGTNQDGHVVTPITAPSGKQQEALLKEVYEKSSIDASDIEYIEAHGTGTQAGDPVEVNSLGNFFLQNTSKSKRFIGSVKTNIGHLESAAGVAGLIKVLLMMKNNTVVPTLLFSKPNPVLDFDKFGFLIPTGTSEWSSKIKLACVNSFGFGGTNAHCIVSTTPGEVSEQYGTNANPFPHIICFSAYTQSSLLESMHLFQEQCTTSRMDLTSIAYTSTVRRDHFPIRKAVVIGGNSHHSKEDIIKSVGSAITAVSEPQSNVFMKNRIIFVFGGMGTAWKGMCKDMMTMYSTFFQVIKEIDESLSKYVTWSLIERIRKQFNPEDPMFGPIAIFSCQVAMAALWKHWGVTPDCIVGQSIGEVAAAHAAGSLSLQDAVKVIFNRTRLLAGATGGKMLIVRQMNVDRVQSMCSKYPGKVGIALYYSPVACAVSGDADAIATLRKELHSIQLNMEEQVIVQDLKVPCAFHSHHIEDCSKTLKAVLNGLTGLQPKHDIISTVTAGHGDFSTADYWAKNMRESVLFHQAICKSFHEKRNNIFLEIGPRPVLKAHLEDIFPTVEAASLPSMTSTNVSTTAETLANLYEYGEDPEWSNMFVNKENSFDIPRYVFNHKNYLHISDDKRQYLMGVDSTTERHPFVKTVSNATPTTAKLFITPSCLGSIYEHKFSGSILVPGALYIEVALAIGGLLGIAEAAKLSVCVEFRKPVILQRDTNVELDIVLKVSKDQVHKGSGAFFTVCRHENVHAEGKLKRSAQYYSEERVDIEHLRDKCQTQLSKKDVYESLKSIGFTYGSAMQIVGNVWKNDVECLAEIDVNDALKREIPGTTLHPVILDGMFQTVGALRHKDDHREFLPLRIGSISMHKTVLDKMFVHTCRVKETDQVICYNILLLTTDGTIIAKVKNFTTKILVSTKSEAIVFACENHWQRVTSLQQGGVEKGTVKYLTFTDTKFTEEFASNGHTIVDIQDKMHTKEIIEDNVNKLKDGSRTFDAVLFVSRRWFDDSTDSTIIQEYIVTEAVALKYVIDCLVKFGLELPLLIVTEKAWTADDSGLPCTSSQQVHIAVSPIWGLVRCLIREQAYSSIKLIEIQPDSLSTFESLLVSTLVQFAEGEFKIYPEILVRNQQIFAQGIQKSSEDVPLHRRMIHSNVSSTALLLSEDVSNVTDPYLCYSDRTFETKLTDGVEVEGQVVTIHDPRLLSPCLHTGASLNSDDDFFKGYPVLTLEIVGQIQQPRSSKSTPLQVVTCYPTVAGNQMLVPKSCIMKREHFPQYRSGWLSKLFICWCLCTDIDTKSVGILSSKSSLAYGHVLMSILKSCGTKSVEILCTDTLCETISSTTLICIVRLTPDIVNFLRSSWKTPVQFVSLEHLASATSVSLICQQNSMLKVALMPLHAIHTPSFFLRTVPKMLNWIKQEKSVVQTISALFLDADCVTFAKGSIPLNVAELLRGTCLDIKDSSLCLWVNEKHLFQKGAIYIIVGGLTGLGWECVKFLASKGAGCMVLLGRRKASEQKQIDIRDLTQGYGCHISFIQTDVTDMTSLEQAFQKIQFMYPSLPINGVFFGAAVLSDGLFMNMSEDKFSTVLSPKVKGAFNIHHLTKNMPLDYFVMHSSVTSVLGNPGQANYGAANSFLDALAHYRRQIGLSGQSINWGPLRLGMLEDKEMVASKLEKQGYVLLDVPEIHRCLSEALMSDKPQLIITKFNTEKLTNSLLTENNQSLRSRLTSILPLALPVTRNDDSAEQIMLDTRELQNLCLADRKERVFKYVLNVIAYVLSCNPSQIDPDKGFYELGVDSMQAMTVMNKITKNTTIRLPTGQILLENLSIRQISDLLDNSIKDQKGNLEMTKTSETSSNLHPDSLSYMEMAIYSEYLQDPSSLSLFLVSDIKIPYETDTEFWKEVVKDLLERHPITRTVFTSTLPHETIRWNMKRHVLSLDTQPDLIMIDEETPDRLQEEIQRHTEKPFDLSSHGPIRFIVYSSRTTLFRLVCYAIGFDLKSISILIDDLKNICLAKSKQTSPAKLTVPDPAAVALEMEENLQPQIDQLKGFWQQKLMANIPSVSFCSVAQSCGTGKTMRVETKLNAQLCNKLLDLSKSNGLTIFKIIAGVFQLLLCLTFKTGRAAITTPVDMRQHIPAISKVVARCINHVVLIAEAPNPSDSALQFLMKNSKTISESVDKSIFPSHLAKEMMDQKSQVNSFCHRVIWNDISFAGYLYASASNAGFEVETNFEERLSKNTETSLFILSDRNLGEITLRCLYHADQIHEDRAERILMAVIGLLQDITKEKSVLISQLQAQPYIRNILTEMPSKGMKTQSSLCEIQ